MKSINTSINGLASSLLLNFGFSTLAEKLDPMQAKASNDYLSASDPCTSTCTACYFTPDVGQ